MNITYTIDPATLKVGDKVQLYTLDDAITLLGKDTLRGTPKTAVYTTVSDCAHLGKIAIVKAIYQTCGPNNTPGFMINGCSNSLCCQLIKSIIKEDKPMRYNKGDKVIVREWDDLVAEYGLAGGSIRRPDSVSRGQTQFHEAKRKYCGRVCEVHHCDDAGDLVLFQDGRDIGHYVGAPYVRLLSPNVPVPEEAGTRSYNVGDRVTVREWDDLASQYGVDEDGDIDFTDGSSNFMACQRKHCGKTYTIREIEHEEDGEELYFDGVEGSIHPAHVRPFVDASKPQTPKTKSDDTANLVINTFITNLRNNLSIGAL